MLKVAEFSYNNLTTIDHSLVNKLFVFLVHIILGNNRPRLRFNNKTAGNAGTTMAGPKIVHCPL